MLILEDIERNRDILEALTSIHTKCKKWLLQLKTVHSNCHSMRKKHLELRSFYNDFGANCIYGLEGTWLTSTDSNKFYKTNPHQFDVHRCDRQDKKGGGLLF